MYETIIRLIAVVSLAFGVLGLYALDRNDGRTKRPRRRTAFEELMEDALNGKAEGEGPGQTGPNPMDLMLEILEEDRSQEDACSPEARTLAYSLFHNWRKDRPLWQETETGWMEWRMHALLPARLADGVLVDEANSCLMVAGKEPRGVATFRLAEITTGLLDQSWRLKEPEAEKEARWLVTVNGREGKRAKFPSGYSELIQSDSIHSGPLSAPHIKREA